MPNHSTDLDTFWICGDHRLRSVTPRGSVTPMSTDTHTTDTHTTDYEFEYFDEADAEFNAEFAMSWVCGGGLPEDISTAARQHHG